jgi:hypothetical protein
MMTMMMTTTDAVARRHDGLPSTGLRQAAPAA